MNITNAIKTLRRNLTGVNAFANLADVNEAVNKNVGKVYDLHTSSGKLDGKANELTTPVSSVTKNIYNYSFVIKEDVTNALLPGKRLNFANAVYGDLFSIDSIIVTLGTQVAYDGGDLQIFLGDVMIGVIPAASLVTGVNTATLFKVPVLPNVLLLGTGGYTAAGIGLTPAWFIDHYNMTLNIRLSGATTGFLGEIGVTVTSSIQPNVCGVRCDTICNYGEAGDQYCSTIGQPAGGYTCAFCPTLGGSFTATNIT